MGTICGRSGSDTIGIAIDAEWIAANTIAGGNPHTSRTIAALQWAINPDSNLSTTNDIPAVINCSWYDASADPCNNIYKSIFEQLENLGIAVFFSAGNEGPNSSTISAPQSLIINDFNPFTVGNLDGDAFLNGNSNSIFNISSRGPSPCTQDSSLKIKPTVCAPGTDILSSIPGNKYAKMTGTSMASPHTAGVYALLKQIYPNKSVSELK
jgi:subtilisin family serine protease